MNLDGNDNQIMAIEWHYAPITGVLAQTIDGKFEPFREWEEVDEYMADFIRLRASGAIKLKKTLEYGHPHFHGNRGRVDIYE